jgi:ABC-type polar amino acid transport system ATPase subunit
MIKLESVSKRFGKRYVLLNVGLEWYPKDIVVIKGPSGGGKSTLARIIALLDKADKGKIFIEDFWVNYDGNEDMEKIKKEVGKRVSMVFQQLHLWPHLTVRKNVELVVKNRKDKWEEFERLVKFFGVGELLDKYPTQISLGEKQRIAIIRNILTDAQYLVWDEATSALDRDNILKVVEEILYQIEARRRAFLLITHDEVFFSALPFKKTFWLENGRLLELEI